MERQKAKEWDDHLSHYSPCFNEYMVALSIYLPTGSEPAKYQVEIVEQPRNPLISVEGDAALRDHIAVLEVNVDLQRLHPGLYLVGIRKAGWSWAYYPVVLK